MMRMIYHKVPDQKIYKEIYKFSTSPLKNFTVIVSILEKIRIFSSLKMSL